VIISKSEKGKALYRRLLVGESFIAMPPRRGKDGSKYYVRDFGTGSAIALCAETQKLRVKGFITKDPRSARV
jgi:hypothetical protein